MYKRNTLEIIGHKCSFFLIYTSLCAAYLAGSCFNSSKLLVHTPNLIKFRITRKISDSVAFNKRESLLYGPIHRLKIYYSIPLAFGAPLQHFEANLDMKHPGTYILSQFGENCSENERLSFCPGESKTFLFKGNKSGVSIDSGYNVLLAYWGADTLSINLNKISEFNFLGVSIYPGSRSVVGIGKINQGFITTEDKELELETNFLKQLKKKGFIASNCYSLWVGDDNNDGIIIFGHYDTRYTKNPLYLLPLVEVYQKPGFYLNLDSVGIVIGKNPSRNLVNTTLLAEIDFTSVSSTLPSDFLDPLNAYLEVEYGAYNFLCSVTSSNSGIELVFSGVTYTLLFRDISPNTTNRTHNCLPPFSLGKTVTLGTNILKCFYAVFDLDKNEIGLALLNFSETGNSHSIVTLSTGIPGISAPLYFTTR